MAKKETPKWLTKEEAKSLINQAKTQMKESLAKRLPAANPTAREAMLAAIGMLSGCRIGEISSGTWGDIWARRDPPELSIRKGKRGKARDIAIPQELLDFFGDFKRWCKMAKIPTGRDSPFFASPVDPKKALGSRALQLAIERIGKAAGIKRRLNPHMMRHTYATHLWIASRRDMDLVRRQLGHDSTATTMIYIGTLKSAISQALSELYDD